MAQAKTQVPLLATVVLLLDDEGELVGKQLAQLSQSLDPVVRARLGLLRLSGVPGAVQAAPLVEEQRVSLPSQSYARLSTVGSYSTPGSPYALPQPSITPDPGITQVAELSHTPSLALGVNQPLDVALRAMLQSSARSGGADLLAQHGYSLVPNELAVYIIGRIDSDLLSDVAAIASETTRSLAAQTDARRFALLVAAPITDDPRDAPRLNGNVRGLASASANAKDWQAKAARQPWNSLLSWQHGEPPLHYAFLYEPWDESGRYHPRADLHYAIAESLYALFASGLLEHPRLKDSLDMSTAMLDDSGGLNRVGSIGTSRITTPSDGMLDFLAHRFAADVLLRRGLLGEEGGVPLPETRLSIPEEARQDADRWVKGTLRRQIEAERYVLPAQLPPRVLEDGERGSWYQLALSHIDPDPLGVFWHWNRQAGRLMLDDETFWNLSVQNEFEAAGELEQWKNRLAGSLPTLAQDFRQQLSNALRLRTLSPEGVDRANAFATALEAALVAEERRLQDDQQTQQVMIEQHLHQFEDTLRRSHPNQGIPLHPNPPPNDLTPFMPRNMEGLSHEVIDIAFARVPLPLTLVVVALLTAFWGAFAITPLAGLPAAAHLPTGVYQALTGSSRHLIGAGIALAIYALTLIGPLVRALQLRKWQQRYAQERQLLWLARARESERIIVIKLVRDLLYHIGSERSRIRGWQQEIEEAAIVLAQEAANSAQTQLAGSELARDLFVVRGMVWQGVNPDELYLHVRQQHDEIAVINRWLQDVQGHGSDIINALNQGSIHTVALNFMRDYLHQESIDDPFTHWEAVMAQEVIERARHLARVPIQPQVAGKPIGHFEALAIEPTVAWASRIAEEHGMVTLPITTRRWAMVIRVITRTHNALIH